MSLKYHSLAVCFILSPWFPYFWRLCSRQDVTRLSWFLTAQLSLICVYSKLWFKISFSSKCLALWHVVLFLLPLTWLRCTVQVSCGLILFVWCFLHVCITPLSHNPLKGSLKLRLFNYSCFTYGKILWEWYPGLLIYCRMMCRVCWKPCSWVPDNFITCVAIPR